MNDKLKAYNAGLVKAMAAMKANDNAQTRNDFVRELLNSKLILPSMIRPEPVDGKLAPNSVMSFFSVKTKNGDSVLFLFTSAEELRKWAPAKGKQLILQRYSQFKTFIEGSDSQYDAIVIDPYGENVTIKRSLVERIDAVAQPMVLRREKIDVKEYGLQPAEYASPGLYAAFSEVMAKNELINSAWMMQTKRGDSKLPTTIVVVDVDKKGDRTAIFNGLAAVSNEFLAPEESIGIMSARDAVAASYIENVKPFYIKGETGVEFKTAKADEEEE
jgi:hypothetical protein